jgi:hypothetical protein
MMAGHGSNGFSSDIVLVSCAERASICRSLHRSESFYFSDSHGALYVANDVSSSVQFRSKVLIKKGAMKFFLYIRKYS